MIVGIPKLGHLGAAMTAATIQPHSPRATLTLRYLGTYCLYRMYMDTFSQRVLANSSRYALH